MKFSLTSANQRGMVLVVSLLFLLVVTMISVVAASNSNLGLKISANMQDAYASFQSAEAGALAIWLLADDPFGEEDSLAPFAGINADNHPLRNLPGSPTSVDVDLYVTGRGLECPPSRTPTSTTKRFCNFYRIESEHVAPNQARTKVNLGAIKPLEKG